MTTIQIKHHLYEEMTKYLENMCAYLATGEEDLFHYYAGKADSYRELLDELFAFDERYASGHIKAMRDIMDEDW